MIGPRMNVATWLYCVAGRLALIKDVMSACRVGKSVVSNPVNAIRFVAGSNWLSVDCSRDSWVAADAIGCVGRC